MPGHFALILHAHLPFVRHPEHEHFVEEEWLFEVITETYIPLLRMMQLLVDDFVPFKLTMSITPTLCAMLQDQLLCERYVRHLELLIDLAARERKRNRKHPQLCELAEFYLGLFSETRRHFVDEWKCDLLSVFRELRQTGVLEIIASAATHGLLPILQRQSPRAARAQVLIGRDVYVEVFGEEATGFWLPECGYAAGLESILQEANLRWFVVDAHGLLFGTSRPCRSIYAPCYTPAGPAAFARDPSASRQVWSADEGYPGDPAYRDFYRDIGFELLIVAPFDAELFEHWWFEGPIFLEQFIRHAAKERDFRLTTPSEYLAAHPTQQIVEPAASTWGENGHLAVWLDPSNAWIYPQLYAAALRMCEVAGRYAAEGSNMTDACDRVLKQLARELLLAQSIDWAFLMKTGTAREYATQRTIDHLARFNRLHDQFVINNFDEEFLRDCEWRDHIFPNVNWRYYA